MARAAGRPGRGMIEIWIPIMLRFRLKVRRLEAAAIERGVRARYAKL